jgi:hypothetical protein
MNLLTLSLNHEFTRGPRVKPSHVQSFVVNNLT